MERILGTSSQERNDRTSIQLWTSVYASRQEKYFRHKVPLVALLQSLRNTGSSQPVNVLFLDGLACLSSKFVGTLQELGAKIIDAQQLFSDIKTTFPVITRNTNAYGQAMFFRWIVASRLFTPMHRIHLLTHIDSDLIFFAKPEDFLPYFLGKTFIMEGCPSFTCISDKTWFDRYESRLRCVEADLAAYQNTMSEFFSLTTSPQIQSKCIWIDNPHSHRLLSTPGYDQSLLQHMVVNNELPQSASGNIFSNPFYYVNVISCIGSWHALQNVERDARFFLRQDNVLCIGNKRVAFVHCSNELFYRLRIFLFICSFVRGAHNSVLQSREMVLENKGLQKLFFYIERGLMAIGIDSVCRDMVTTRVISSPKGVSQLSEFLNEYLQAGLKCPRFQLF